MSGSESCELLIDLEGLKITAAQLEEAKKRVRSPDSANQLMLALLEVSQNEFNPKSNPNVVDSQDSNQNNGSQVTGNLTNTNNDDRDKDPNLIILDKESTSSCYSSLCSVLSNEETIPKSLINSNKQGYGLRKIYVDGSNVAKSHGNDTIFSWQGIRICVEWFHSRNHIVRVFVPEDRCQSIDNATLVYLNYLKALIRTPKGCNDDTFIIDAAIGNDGVIVSNDQYRDEKKFNDDYKKYVHANRLPFIFVDDQFIPARDPRGRFGPSLDEFLRFGSKSMLNYTDQMPTQHRFKAMSYHQYNPSRANSSLMKPHSHHLNAHNRRSLQPSKNNCAQSNYVYLSSSRTLSSFETGPKLVKNELNSDKKPENNSITPDSHSNLIATNRDLSSTDRSPSIPSMRRAVYRKR